jgi:hypothetical protein
MARRVIPSRGEFEVKGDEVTHTPTGATWTAHPGRPESHSCRQAMLGSVLRNGDDYHPHEVQEWAERLLRERLTRK